MKLQLRKMREAIEAIRNASDQELHEILVSLGAEPVAEREAEISCSFRIHAPLRRMGQTVHEQGVPSSHLSGDQ